MSSSLYFVWYDMMARCYKMSHPVYPNYGGRGITVCAAWHNRKIFEADMGPRPDGMSIERKDNSKGYSKDNCCWATPLQQARNTRRNRCITWNGETLCLSAWADRLGINRKTFSERIRLGWSIEDAMQPTMSRSEVGRYAITCPRTIHRGEASHFHKLTEQQVLQIRAATGSNRLIAEKFGVSRRLVSGIRDGEFWRHLT